MKKIKARPHPDPLPREEGTVFDPVSVCRHRRGESSGSVLKRCEVVILLLGERVRVRENNQPLLSKTNHAF